MSWEYRGTSVALRVIHVAGRAAVALGLCGWLGGCIAPPRRLHPAPPRGVERDHYAEAQRRFRVGVFAKPRDSSLPWLPSELAPLIVHELTDTWEAASTPEGRFGAIRRHADGTLLIDTDRPTVYAAKSTVTIHGAVFNQLVFLWWYPPSRGAGGPIACGVRVTLGGDGFPMIWEVLGHQSDTKLVYAARWLEESAGRSFGPPLANRRFSIERAVGAGPHAIVPNVLEDGPMAMGPIVYVRAIHRSITSVTCRCMPSLVDDLVVTGSYELSPLDLLITGAFDDLWRHSADTLASHEADETEGVPLEQLLRVPASVTE